MNEELQKKLTGIIAEQLNVDESMCVPEAAFIDDLGADSLDIVELVMAMEDNFDIEINDEELTKVRTIKDVLAFIEKAQAK